MAGGRFKRLALVTGSAWALPALRVFPLIVFHLFSSCKRDKQKMP
jgi:hypothetical protein